MSIWAFVHNPKIFFLSQLFNINNLIMEKICLCNICTLLPLVCIEVILYRVVIAWYLCFRTLFFNDKHSHARVKSVSFCAQQTSKGCSHVQTLVPFLFLVGQKHTVKKLTVCIWEIQLKKTILSLKIKKSVSDLPAFFLIVLIYNSISNTFLACNRFSLNCFSVQLLLCSQLLEGVQVPWLQCRPKSNSIYAPLFIQYSITEFLTTTYSNTKKPCPQKKCINENIAHTNIHWNVVKYPERT